MCDGDQAAVDDRPGGSFAGVRPLGAATARYDRLGADADGLGLVAELAPDGERG